MSLEQYNDKMMDEQAKPVTVRLSADQWEVVQQALQQRAAALLAARDSHLLTHKDAVAMHRITWGIYGEISDQVGLETFMQNVEALDDTR